MKTVTPSSYERIIQWSAGPIAILAGWLATQITNHFSIFGSLDLGAGKTGQSQVAHAIVAGTTFLVGAGVTYMAHHKVLDNIQKRWESDKVQAIAGEVGQFAPALVTKDADGFVMPSAVEITSEIDKMDDALTKLLADPGTPAASIPAGAGLAATPPVPA
jgi:hypothetical protein